MTDESNIEVLPTYDEISAKIKHVLSIYPKLSMSMLQIGIGTGIPPAAWKPVLFQMIESGEIVRDHHPAATPAGRVQTYVVLSLATV